MITDGTIYQYRWFNSLREDWDEWKITTNLDGIRYCISIGDRYQIRTLEQTKIEGWDIND
jgi:hypothetical protein